ncbi:MAG: Hpt domain-containing protein, partial [Candidatus Omnitrophica bacterium]|nr:Hpt domain-containing protein [Candidatus Omnitrophota bacterium]
MVQDSYRELFFSESQEYLTIINKCLLRIETNSGDFEAINEIFRCIHTLKGMSATMGYDKLTQLSHHAEDLLDELRGKRKKVTPEIIDVLFGSVDILERLIDAAKAKKESAVDIVGYVDKIKKIIAQKGEVLVAAPAPKTKGLEFSEAEAAWIKELKAAGLNIIKIRITLVKDCAMKEARAFLLLTNLKMMGEFIKSIPPVEDLKDGNFDLSFVFILAVKENIQAFHNKLSGVAEVEEVFIEPVEIGENVPGAAQPQTTPSYIKKIQSMRITVD